MPNCIPAATRSKCDSCSMVSCRTRNGARRASWRFRRPLRNAQSSSEKDGAFIGNRTENPELSEPRPSSVHTRCAEVAALHDGDLRRIHVAPEDGVYLLERERLQFGVKLRIPFERPAVRFASRNQIQQPSVARSAAD